MSCPNCGDPAYIDNDACFQCGYNPCIGPGTDIDWYDAPIPLPPPAPLAETPGVAAWRAVCPMCHKQSFDGWNCANPECNYSILDRMRKMHGCILSPEEAAQKRKELGIP